MAATFWVQQQTDVRGGKFMLRRQGRSAIDNTVLRKTFLQHEARKLLAVILSYAGVGFISRRIVLVVSLSTLILLFRALHCYCSYSLPFI